MTSAITINGAGESSMRNHNEQSPFDFRMSHLNYGDCSPLFLYQYKQASTACERFAKTFSSIIRSIQSRRSCSIVTLMRGLFSDIQYDSIIPMNINIGKINVTFIGLNPIGVTTNGREQSISGSYAGDQDYKEVRGNPNGGEQHPDSVSGAEHPRRYSGFSCPFIGAGIGFPHEEGRFGDRIYAVRILIVGCAA